MLRDIANLSSAGNGRSKTEGPKDFFALAKTLAVLCLKLGGYSNQGCSGGPSWLDGPGFPFGCFAEVCNGFLPSIPLNDSLLFLEGAFDVLRT